jgi:hypothetical protein
MNRNEFTKLLVDACDAAGSQKAWASAHGFAGSFVSDVIKERRKPSERMLSALRLRRVESFEPIGEAVEGR